MMLCNVADVILLSIAVPIAEWTEISLEKKRKARKLKDSYSSRRKFSKDQSKSKVYSY